MGSATVTEESHCNAESGQKETAAYDGARIHVNGIPLQSTSENSPEGSQL